MKKLLAVLLLCVAVYAQRQVSLEISADQSGVIPLGVVMFQAEAGSEPMGELRPWLTIANDLDFTGSFAVKRLNTADPSVLMKEQIPVYIEGTYKRTRDTIVLEILLYDSGRKDLLLGRSYKFHEKDVNLTAHKYASVVHNTLLGEEAPYESKIVYVERGANNTKNIVLVDYDGQNKNYLTKGGINIMPAFVDKKDILCVAYDKGKPDIYMINTHEGKKTQIVATRRVESSPTYCDINGRIAFASSKSGNMEIYTVTRDGTDEQRITVGTAISTSPNWSPNGNRIAFISDRTGSPQVYIADRTGSNAKRITFGGPYHDSPSFSPDGTRIAYTAQRGGKKMIAVSLADGREEELITQEISGHQEYPSWSPDGSHILYTQTQGGRSNINAIRLKDKRVIRITTSGNAEQANWSGF